MTSTLADVPVDDGESLARFVLFDGHVRKSDRTLRAEAFLPYKHVELSVTRHRDLKEGELWALGEAVAHRRERPLTGRGDILARTARSNSLDVVPHEGPGKGDRNHANIINWPPEKPAQMVRALELAASATFVSRLP